MQYGVFYTDDYTLWGAINLSDCEFKFLHVLLTFRDFKTGLCKPSLYTLSKLTGKDVRTIQRAISSLKKLKIITGAPEVGFVVTTYKSGKVLPPEVKQSSRHSQQLLKNVIAEMYPKE